jgi:hypothetical protein
MAYVIDTPNRRLESFVIHTPADVGRRGDSAIFDTPADIGWKSGHSDAEILLYLILQHYI